MRRDTDIQFTNECPVSYEEITASRGVLVRTIYIDDADKKTKYSFYYLDSRENFLELENCILNRDNYQQMRCIYLADVLKNEDLYNKLVQDDRNSANSPDDQPKKKLVTDNDKLSKIFDTSTYNGFNFLLKIKQSRNFDLNEIELMIELTKWQAIISGGFSLVALCAAAFAILPFPIIPLLKLDTNNEPINPFNPELDNFINFFRRNRKTLLGFMVLFLIEKATAISIFLIAVTTVPIMLTTTLLFCISLLYTITVRPIHEMIRRNNILYLSDDVEQRIPHILSLTNSEIAKIANNYEKSFSKRHPNLVSFLSLGIFSSQQSMSSKNLVSLLRDNHETTEQKRVSIYSYTQAEENKGKALYCEIIRALPPGM